MKVVFLIGTNDVGGAEYVSYQHVMMAHRNKLDMLVLSGTTGKFYDLMVLAGVRIEVIGMQPDPKVLTSFMKGCSTVFNCNFFGCIPLTIEIKNKMGFRHLLILHNNTKWLCEQVLKYDAGIDGYYSIHQKIIDSIVSRGRIDVRKFVVIPNCVDVAQINRTGEGANGRIAERTKARRELGFTDHHFVIGMVTRVGADKNILDALNILSRLPDGMNTRLLIIGGASANESSERYCRKVMATIQRDVRLRNKVTITGNLEMEAVYHTMMAFDLGLNCSPSEGLPIAMLEMMAAGITCVMPGIGDIPDVLTDRGMVIPIRQRFLVKEIFQEPCYTPQEVQLFVNAIRQIYADKNKRTQLGQEAMQFVSDCRSLEYQEGEFLKFIGEKRMTEKIPMTRIKTNDTKKNGLPNVSVLMPTRDGELEWIKEAIESIVNQDYRGEIEFVIVNHDCRLSMTEDIEALRRGSGTGVSRNITIKHELIKDSGVVFSEALDFGVSKCTGEIIVRMDHDDIAYPEMVSKLVDYLQLHPDIDVCGVQVRFFGVKEMVTHHPAIVTREMAVKMPNWWIVNHPGCAMRKAALLEVGGYGHTPQGMAEDYHLWCKFLKSGRVIANLPDALLKYRCYHHDRVRPEGYIEFLEREKRELKN